MKKGEIGNREEFSRLSLKCVVRPPEQPGSRWYLFVHGRGGNREVMKIFTRSLPPEAGYVLVEAPFEDEVIGGFSWWDAEARPLPIEQVNRAASLLGALLSELKEEYGLEAKTSICCGFSQGAGILSWIISQNGYRPQGFAVLAGFLLSPPKEEYSVSADLPRFPVFWGHGEDDRVIPFSRAEEGVSRLRELNFPVTFISDPVGHKLGSQAMRALKEWLLDPRQTDKG